MSDQFSFGSLTCLRTSHLPVLRAGFSGKNTYYLVSSIMVRHLPSPHCVASAPQWAERLMATWDVVQR